jgi:hypothetical protein
MSKPISNRTPVFPAWRPRLAPLGRRTAHLVRQLRSQTLCQIETCFAPWIPAHLFPKAPAKENSRDGCYTRWRTFWCMLWQCLNPEAPGREVVRQLQALFGLENGPDISEEDGAYCRAKARLPLAEFPKALSATAQAADQLAPALGTLRDKPLKAMDGSALTLADTPKNRQAYPPLQCPQGPSFPMMRIVVLCSMISGAILAAAQGSLAVSELSRLASLASQINAGDILVGDRGFGSYPVIAWLKHGLEVDFIGRTTRGVDGRRRHKRLGPNDWLMVWQPGASTCSPWLSEEQRKQLPGEMIVRAIKGQCQQKGYRVRGVTVVTTLLDPKRYPAEQILAAYLRRWRLEMCLDDLKTTLKMDTLRGRTPPMAQKEMYMRLIGQNLIRCVAAQAAGRGEVPLERISFKGTLDALRQYTQALSRARTRKQWRELWDGLLQTLAADLVPERPGRREPRAVKRKKNKYARLNTSRKKYRDRPKRHTRRKTARLRRLGLM